MNDLGIDFLLSDPDEVNPFLSIEENASGLQSHQGLFTVQGHGSIDEIDDAQFQNFAKALSYGWEPSTCSDHAVKPEPEEWPVGLCGPQRSLSQQILVPVHPGYADSPSPSGVDRSRAAGVALPGSYANAPHIKQEPSSWESGRRSKQYVPLTAGAGHAREEDQQRTGLRKPSKVMKKTKSARIANIKKELVLEDDDLLPCFQSPGQTGLQLSKPDQLKKIISSPGPPQQMLTPNLYAPLRERQAYEGPESQEMKQDGQKLKYTFNLLKGQSVEGCLSVRELNDKLQATRFTGGWQTAEPLQCMSHTGVMGTPTVESQALIKAETELLTPQPRKIPMQKLSRTTLVSSTPASS